jgi:hypothetical protein
VQELNLLSIEGAAFNVAYYMLPEIKLVAVDGFEPPIPRTSTLSSTLKYRYKLGRR